MPPREPSSPDSSRGRSRHRREPPPPPVDERLVMPETRFEVIDGKVEYVAPADEPHGTLHVTLSALLHAHAARGYNVAADMLTRTSARGDMAPDASVYPAARDPETGGRQLEEMAFEIVSTERLGHAAKKARALHKRGVRRVFAIDVKRRRALAWSSETDGWSMLDPEGSIEDRCLSVPLPIRTLVDAAHADDGVAAALLAKKNPLIEEAIQTSEARGKKAGEKEGEKRGQERGVREGKIASVLAVLEARGVAVSAKQEKKIRKETSDAVIDDWIRRAALVTRTSDLLKE